MEQGEKFVMIRSPYDRSYWSMSIDNQESRERLHYYMMCQGVLELKVQVYDIHHGGFRTGEKYHFWRGLKQGKKLALVKLSYAGEPLRYGEAPGR